MELQFLAHPLVSVLPSIVGIHALMVLAKHLSPVFVLWVYEISAEGHNQD
jgi:hypothetical protein